MLVNRATRRAIAGLASLTLLAACASTTATQGQSPPSGLTASPPPAASPAATPTPDASPSPEATPTPSPRSWGDTVLVTGTQRCAAGVGTVTTDVVNEIKQRGGTIECVNELNDPRVNGEIKGTFAFDGWGSSRNNLAFVQWGEVRLENDGGAWVGRYSGVATPDTGDLVTFWFEGTGGYAGLSFFEWSEMPGSLGIVGFPVAGLIFPGSPPDP